MYHYGGWLIDSYVWGEQGLYHSEPVSPPEHGAEVWLREPESRLHYGCAALHCFQLWAHKVRSWKLVGNVSQHPLQAVPQLLCTWLLLGKNCG